MIVQSRTPSIMAARSSSLPRRGSARPISCQTMSSAMKASTIAISCGAFDMSCSFIACIARRTRTAFGCSAIVFFLPFGARGESRRGACASLRSGAPAVARPAQRGAIACSGASAEASSLRFISANPSVVARVEHDPERLPNAARRSRVSL